MDDRRLLILYGSQTGGAKEVAERVEREARKRWFTTELVYMDAYDKRLIRDESLVLFVCSTTGQGEAPENMKKFWTFLRRKDLPACLGSLSFAVFGLGDSGYPIYNAIARMLHQRLLKLGANAIVERGLGDDQHPKGYDGELEPWLTGLWTTLMDKFPLPPGKEIISDQEMSPPLYCVKVGSGALDENAVPLGSVPFGEGGGQYNPHNCPVVSDTRVTHPDHTQDVRHVEFDLTGSGLTYVPGDVLVVHPRNPATAVAAFLELAGLQPSDVLHIAPNPSALTNGWIKQAVYITAQELAESHLDIQGCPRRYFFEQLQNFTADEREKEKLEDFTLAENQDELYQYCQREKRTYIEVLEQFPGARPPVDYLLSMVPRLQPRLFSLSSALLAHPQRAHVTAAVVNFTTPWKQERTGICSSFLASLGSSDSVQLSVTKGTIRMPSDPKTNVILVGPGTGIAPFRSMCHHRRAFLQRERRDGDESLGSTAARLELGSIDVYYGNRYSDKDYFYREEWESMVAEGVIRSINTAFSRDQKQKVYVQDELRRNGADVWRVLSEGGHFILAGNAKQMPKDVREALENVCEQHGGMDETEAKAYMTKMGNSKRFVMETW
jgi:sulfite reductase alpha subunit-like flavoprotein